MTVAGAPPDPVRFIRDNTKVLRPPLVPELRLHLAEESLPIWHKTEEEIGAIGLPPPYWAFAWAGGQALARYVLDTPEVVRGKAVLDLAAGSGLAAIAAMLVGATSAIANDIDTFAIAAIGLNAELNGVSVTADASDRLTGPPAGEPVILVGDLFYEKPLAERVLAWLGRCRDAGCLVLTGDPGRSYFPRSAFTQLAEHRVPVTRELEDAEIKRTGVWRLA